VTVDERLRTAAAALRTEAATAPLLEIDSIRTRKVADMDNLSGLTQRRGRRLLWPAAAAVAAAVVVVVMILVLNNDDEQGGIDTVGDPSPTVATSTTVNTTTTEPPPSLNGSIVIETITTLTDEPPGGTFEVTEGADVLGCTGGSFVDTFPDSGPPIIKTLTCESGVTTGGTVTISYNLDSPGLGDENGRWRIDDATGSYTGLNGGGSIALYFTSDTTTTETITGDVNHS
jgi:hypothetical protein